MVIAAEAVEAARRRAMNNGVVAIFLSKRWEVGMTIPQ